MIFNVKFEVQLSEILNFLLDLACSVQFNDLHDWLGEKIIKSGGKIFDV